MDKIYNKISDRMKFTFLFSFFSTIIIHLFMLVNNWKNHDSLWHLHSDMNLSSSGRFTLKYLGLFSSYFDLHYLNLFISCIFLSLGVTILVEIFEVTNKKHIALFSVIYAAFPSVSGIFSYAFTADAYFISFFLTIVAIYICTKNKWLCIVGIGLIYIALGTYQANLTLAIIIVILIFVQRLLNGNEKTNKEFILYFITITTGLLLYVIHFKIYQIIYRELLTEYGGISEAGNINFDTIITAFKSAQASFNDFIFNNFHFINLFEIFNLVFLLLIVVSLIMLVATSKIKITNSIFVLLILFFAPYYVYLIYFVSPNVYYHVLMLQNVPLISLIGIFILQNHKLEIKIFNVLKKMIIVTLIIISFNLILITNIYYEKLSLINSYTDSLMTKISYRIETHKDYPNIESIMVIGNPSTHLNIAEVFNNKVPFNVGVNTIAFNGYTTANYLNNFMGHHLNVVEESSEFAKEHLDIIENMTVWPTSESVKVIDNTIIIKFE